MYMNIIYENLFIINLSIDIYLYTIIQKNYYQIIFKNVNVEIFKINIK